MILELCKPINPGESNTIRIVLSVHEAAVWRDELSRASLGTLPEEFRHLLNALNRTLAEHGATNEEPRYRSTYDWREMRALHDRVVALETRADANDQGFANLLLVLRESATFEVMKHVLATVRDSGKAILEDLRKQRTSR